MALSGGCAWIPNTAFSQATGDSREKSLTYLEHMQQDYTNFDVMNAFLDNGQTAIDVLAEGGVNLQPMCPTGSNTTLTGRVRTPQAAAPS